MKFREIRLEDFNKSPEELLRKKSECKIIEIMDNIHNKRFFIREGFNLTEEQINIFNESKEIEQNYLIESVSKSNIEKAMFILDKSNEKIIKELRETRGNIKNLNNYHVIQDMIKELELVDTKNQEVSKAKEILHELEINKARYTNAFSTDNTYRKTIYYSAALSAIFTIIKEHLMFLDITSSKNEHDLVLVKDAHYVSTDANNLKNLKNNLKLVKSKVAEGHTANHGPVTESLGLETMISVGSMIKGTASAVGSAVGAAATTVGTAIGNATVAATPYVNAATAYVASMSPIIGSAIAALLALGAIIALYFIVRKAARGISDYIASYAYIRHTAEKSNLKGDKIIFHMIDKLVKFRKIIRNVFSSNSKNVNEYMKDLQADVDIIKQSEGIPSLSSANRKIASSRSSNTRSHSSNDFI